MKTDQSSAGVLAALGISLTAAVALPLVNVFQSLEPSELMIVRGGVTASLVLFLFTTHVTKPSKRILAFSLLFSLATLGLYSGIRAWGASPTLVVLTMTPVVNIAAKLIHRQAVDRRVYACLTGLLLGVVIALNPRQSHFDLMGLFCSLAAAILAGVGFEVLAGQKGVDPYNKSFWLAVVTMAVGLIATLACGQLPFASETWHASNVFALVGFGAVGGFAYYLANIVAFEKLPTEVASTLAMAETPAVIVAAWLMLGETLTLIQWIGVAIALGATAALSAAETRQKSNQ